MGTKRKVDSVDSSHIFVPKGTCELKMKWDVSLPFVVALKKACGAPWPKTERWHFCKEW